ncbi:MAG: MFS transporter [Nocardioidaceae bacterium]
MTAPAVAPVVPAAPPFGRDRRVQLWAVTAAVSQAGDAAWAVALAWTATRLAGPAEAGLVIGAGTAPRALVTLYGGALADRLDPRRVMVVANLGRVLVLVAAIAASTYRGVSVPELLAVAVLFGVFDAVYNPAGMTLPRQMVRAEDLPRSAALFQIGRRVATFVGAPVGGFLVAVGDLRAVMAVDAASFLLISVFLATALRPRFPRPPVSGGSVRSGLAAGFRYLRDDVRVRTLVVSLTGLNLFVGPALAVGVALHVHASGWGATTLGLSEAAVGVGAGLGAAATLRWRAPNPFRTGLLVLVGQAAAIAVLGFTSRPALLLAAAVIGVTAGVASAQLSGAFQALVDPSYLGRMGALTSLGDDVLMPVAMAGFGALAASAGLPAACLVTGALFAMLVLWSATRAV